MKKAKNNQGIRSNKAGKRSIYLLNKGVQFKYALLLALIGGLVAFLFSIHIFYFLNENIQVFIPNFRDDAQVAEVIFREYRKMIAYLGSLVLLLMSILFFLGVVMTHRIVGPVMVIRKKMEELSDGNFSVRARLRKNDEFSELADSFNEMAEKLEKKFKG